MKQEELLRELNFELFFKRKINEIFKGLEK